MNEQEFIRDITRALDQGAGGMDAATTARLASARARALRANHQHAGTGLLAHAAHRHPMLGLTAAAILLLAGWFLLTIPQSTDSGEADILLLTDELPPNAYAEQDFSKWINKSETCPSPSSC